MKMWHEAYCWIREMAHFEFANWPRPNGPNFLAEGGGEGGELKPFQQFRFFAFVKNKSTSFYIALERNSIVIVKYKIS